MSYPSPTTTLSTCTTLDRSGTASDNVAVTEVSWTNDRGSSGACNGTDTWSAPGIEMVEGVHVIPVTDNYTLHLYDARQIRNGIGQRSCDGGILDQRSWQQRGLQWNRHMERHGDRNGGGGPCHTRHRQLHSPPVRRSTDPERHRTT